MQVELEQIELSLKITLLIVSFSHILYLKNEPKIQAPERNIKRANTDKNNHFPSHGAGIQKKNYLHMF